MNSKKVIYLFLALLLPGLTFVFLKKFGKNEFNIPIYHRDGVDSTECTFAYAAPYLLPDSLWKSGKKPITIFTLSSETEVTENLEGLSGEFDSTVLDIFKVDSSKLEVITCVLVLKRPWTTVLVDDKKQIRGYYRPNTLEEIDRLKMEMSILLKRY
jgi:hypothetical protein